MNPSVGYDRRYVAYHFELLHHLAARSGIAGKLVLTAFGEGLSPRVQHFRIGDYAGMTAAAIAFEASEYNVYNSLAIYRADLAAGSKGTENDVVALLGAVVDGDADKGKAAPLPPVAANYVIETSPGNRQHFLFFDRAVVPAEAKPLCVALQRATGADAASDICHVWRVAGTLNWPNSAKLKRGRSPSPFRVNAVQPWDNVTFTDVTPLTATLQPHWQKPQAERGASFAAGPLDAPEYDFADAKQFYHWMAENGVIKTDDDWRNAGMAAQFEFGEQGQELWEILATDNGGLTDASLNRWKTFKPPANGKPVRFRTLFDLANTAGWKGRVRESVQKMFGAVTAAYIRGETYWPSIVPSLPLTGMPLPGPWEDDHEQPAARTLNIFNAASFDGLPVPERRWHVRDWIPANTVTLIYGDGGTGKSLVILQLLTSTSLGRPWFNHLVEQGACLFVTAEDSKDEVHHRLADIAREMQVRLSALPDVNVVCLAGEDAIIAAPDGRSSLLITNELFDLIEDQIVQLRPKVVVIDTLADAFGGNEIDRSQARQFIGLLRGWALRYETTVILLAHPSVSGMTKGTGSSGSTGWNNSVRSRIYLDRIRSDDGTEPDPDARVMRCMKSNYGRIGNEVQMRFQRGIFVPSHIAGLSADPMASAAKAERVFIDLLRQYMGQNRYVSTSEGKSYAPFIFRDDAAKQGVSRLALKGAMERLLARGAIENAPHGAPSKKMFRLHVASVNLPTAAMGVLTPC